MKIPPSAPSATPSEVQILATLTGGLAKLVGGESGWLRGSDLRVMFDPGKGELRPDFLRSLSRHEQDTYRAWAQTNRDTLVRLLSGSGSGAGVPSLPH